MLSPLSRGIDRRRILLAFSLLLILSNVLVAMAANYTILLMGRGMLRICIGGFWSMASAVTLQLVPTKDVPKALNIVYAGVSMATILSLPLASYLGQLIGWRNVFLLGSGLGAITFVWQYLTLPSLSAQGASSFRNMFGLIRENWVLAGIGALFSVMAAIMSFLPIFVPFWNMTLPCSHKHFLSRC